MKTPTRPRRRLKTEIDARLKTAMKTVEAQGAPEDLVKAAEALAGRKPGRRDSRN